MLRFHWKIKVRNDEMGFQKSIEVDAVGVTQAMTFAFDKLKLDGYESKDMSVIEVIRGHVVHN